MILYTMAHMIKHSLHLKSVKQIHHDPHGPADGISIAEVEAGLASDEVPVVLVGANANGGVFHMSANGLRIDIESSTAFRHTSIPQRGGESSRRSRKNSFVIVMMRTTVMRTGVDEAGAEHRSGSDRA